MANDPSNQIESKAVNHKDDFLVMFDKLNKHISMVFYTLFISLGVVLVFALILWFSNMLPWQESEYLSIISAYGFQQQVLYIFSALSSVQIALGLVFYLYFRKSPKLLKAQEEMDKSLVLTKVLKRLVTYSIVTWLLFLQIGLYGLLYFMTFNSIVVLLGYSVVAALLLLICRPESGKNLQMIAKITQFPFLHQAVESSGSTQIPATSPTDSDT